MPNTRNTENSPQPLPRHVSPPQRNTPIIKGMPDCAAWDEPEYIDPDNSIGREVGAHYWQGYAKENARPERAMSPELVVRASDNGDPRAPDMPDVPPTIPEAPQNPSKDTPIEIHARHETERERFSANPSEGWPG